ncbi:MAG: LamG-like jellyroll fold domain-containing protein [Bacteroidaceae bacterium]
MMRKLTRMMLTAAFMAALGVPVMAQETEKPVADMLDVQFNADGTAEDISPMKLPVEKVGEGMSTYYNDGYGAVVARFDNTWGSSGSSGYRFDYEQNEDFKNKLSDGHTLEIVIMADYAAVEDKEIKPFSSMESGGTGFLIAKNSYNNVMTFLPNTGSYNWCTSGVQPQKKIYYHFVGVWNQEEAKAYIYCNGKLMNSISTGTQFLLAKDGSKWFCVGGDAGSSVQAGWRGDVAVARVYDDPLTADQVGVLWAAVKTGVDGANTQVYREIIEEGRNYLAGETLLAYAGDIEAYSAQLDKMDELANASDVEGLAAEMEALNALRAAVETSAAAYTQYREQVDATRQYLEENDDFEGAARDLLEDYLQSDEAPGDTYTNGGALYILENGLLTTEEVKAEIEALKQMLKNAIETSVKSGVEVTNLLVNPDFSEGFNGWQGSLMTGYCKSETTGFIGAECWAKNCNMYQTLEHRNNGVYVMEINGAYRPFDDRYSTFYCGQVYLNNIRLYLPTVYENYIPVNEAQDGVNCYLTQNGEDSALDLEVYDNMGASTDLVGYALRGRVSIANAASAGRAQNYLVTMVTDSTLTVGVENSNPVATNDWLGISNLHVKYYETLADAEPYIDLTLECMAARANTIIAYEPSVGADYAQHPGCPKALLNELQTAIEKISACTSPEEKYALVETFSSLFEQVLEARKAYVAMVDEAMVIYDIAQKLDEAKVITTEEYQNVMDKYDIVLNAYESGAYSVEEAKEVAILRETGFYPEIVDGVYQIATNAQLIYFAGKATTGEVGKLTADITNVTYAQILDNLYGILDGNGHKITLNMENPGSSTALINEMRANAEVRNLVIDGTITTDGQYAGAVAVATGEGARISNVTSSVNIVSSILGDGTHGGIVALIHGYTVIENCLFNGTMTGEGTIKCGGFIGWNTNASCIKNSLQVGEITIGADGSNTFARNPVSGSVLNSYYKTVFGTRAGLLASEDQLKSGEICYRLNQGNTENPQWYQTIGEDAYPVLDATHKKVGKTQDGTYTNDESLFFTGDTEVTEPVADLLDIVFNEDGSATDVSPMNNIVDTRGTPEISYNETYKRNMAYFDNPYGGAGTNAYGVDYEDNDVFIEKIASGHTLETICMLTYDSEKIPNSEAKPFSSMEGGGTGFLVTKISDPRQNEFCFLPNVSTSGASTWRWTTCGFVPERGRFYHVIGVYDAENGKARIYVDGKLCNEIATPGAFRFASEGCRWFCIGGDPGDKKAIGNAWRGSVVLARAYGKALTDEEVTLVCQKLERETSIDQVESQETKAREGIYTINGIRVQKTTTGLYIINGKKVLVK